MIRPCFSTAFLSPSLPGSGRQPLFIASLFWAGVISFGVRLQGTQVHSVRLPGYVISVDAIFGMPDQKLILRHESGTSAEPYVNGALLAIREVGKLVGVHRGLDTVMKF